MRSCLRIVLASLLLLGPIRALGEAPVRPEAGDRLESVRGDYALQAVRSAEPGRLPYGSHAGGKDSAGGGRPVPA